MKFFVALNNGLEIKVYKLGKIIENQGIEIQLILYQMDEAKEELRKSLNKSKEISIAKMTNNKKRSTPQNYFLVLTPKNLVHQL